MTIDWKKSIPHLIAVLIFLSVSMVYFYPALQGYALKTHDIKMFKGMSKEIADHRAETGEDLLWTNSMFGGMPSTHISVQYDSNLMRTVYKTMSFYLPRPINIVFLYFIGFYILLMCLKIDPYIAIVGALAFGFSSYFFVILEAGHMSKANAIAFMPPAIGGVILAYRGKLLLGAAVTALFMSLELWANHYQITYYMAFILFFYGLSELVRYFRAKKTKEFVKRSSVIIAAILMAVLVNIGSIWGTSEYAKFTTRGKSELSINASGNVDLTDKTNGLDRSYVTEYSLGTGETFTFLIPDAKGGGSVPMFMLHEDNIKLESINEKAKTLKLNQASINQSAQQLPNEISYWGSQRLVSGPVYIGAVIVLLFLLSLPFVSDKIKWFLFAVTIVAIMLAWGKNYMWFTDLFLDYFPAYNKFRAVTMILVIVELTMPLMAMLFLAKLVRKRHEIQQKLVWFYIVSGGLVLLMLIVASMPGLFFNFFPNGQGELTKDFLSSQYPEMGVDQQIQIMSFYNEGYYPLLKQIRIGIFREDLLRSLGFIIVAIALLYFFIKEKIKYPVLILGIGGLILTDMVSVNLRYLNNESGTGASKYDSWAEKTENKTPFYAYQGDFDILMNEIGDDTELMQKISQKVNAEKQENGGNITPGREQSIWFGVLNANTNYRVFTTNNPFNETRTSYFHKSIGGYHGAKLKRYQELIEFHIGRNNQKVLDMLNTRYLIQSGKNKQGTESANMIPRNTALGNAWFVNNVQLVANADEEIIALGEDKGFDPGNIAIVDNRYADLVQGDFIRDEHGDIEMTSYKPNHLEYAFTAESDQVVIFSEIFYDIGWQAYIDDKPVDHFRVNYVLRGLKIPSGTHKVEFKYELDSYNISAPISLISSILVLLFFGYIFYLEIANKNEVEGLNKELSEVE